MMFRIQPARLIRRRYIRADDDDRCRHVVVLAWRVHHPRPLFCMIRM